MNDEPTLPLDPADFHPQPPLAGRYELGVLLGRGGRGQVHEARDRLTGATVAIKFLRREQLPEARRELALLRLLDVPGVVRLLDEGTDPQPYLVTERLYLGRVFALADPAWRSRLERVLATLSRVHGLGIVHRDVKPSNLLLDAAGQPVLVDFGIARHGLVDPRRVAGTARYMAPEQWEGRAEPRSDLYGLGRMVLEALIGELPAADPDPEEAVAAGVPRTVADVLCRCAASDPDRRPAGAYAAWRELTEPPPLRLPARPNVRQVRSRFVDRPQDRFLHAADDAASEIVRRARHRPADQVVEDLLHQGLLGMEGDGLTVDRSAIRQWETADAVAGLGGREGEAQLERTARRLWRRGMTEMALALLEAAAPTVGVSPRLARLATLQAVAIEQVPALRRARTLVERSTDPAGPDLVALLEGYRRMVERDPAPGEPIEPQPTEELEIERHRLVVRRAAGDPAVLEALGPWAEGRRERTARHLAWLGHARYRQQRYADARELYLRAADLAAPRWRGTALLDAAAACLEIAAFEECAELADRTARTAARMRNGMLECRAVLLTRSAAYRSGACADPDPELPLAAEPFGPLAVAQMALVEAATAWRFGDPRGTALADRASDAFEAAGWTGGAVLARALAVAVSGRDPPDELRVRVGAVQPLEVRAQAAALLVHAAPELGDLGRTALAGFDGPRGIRRAVLSPAECADRLATRSTA